MKSKIVISIVMILVLTLPFGVSCAPKGGASPTAEPTFEPTPVPSCPPDVAGLEGDVSNYEIMRVDCCVPTEEEAAAIAGIICRAVFPEVDFDMYTVHVCYASPSGGPGYYGQWVVSYSRIGEDPNVDKRGPEIHIKKWNAEVTYLSSGRDGIFIGDCIPTEKEAEAVADTICKAVVPEVDYSKYTIHVYSPTDEEWLISYRRISGDPSVVYAGGGGPEVHIKMRDGGVTYLFLQY